MASRYKKANEFIKRSKNKQSFKNSQQGHPYKALESMMTKSVSKLI